MKVQIDEHLSREAEEIRREVFMEEQGFRQEFDETDESCLHIVIFSEEGQAAGVCRLIPEKSGVYRLGRVAVRRAFRGQGLGRKLLEAAEEEARSRGGREMVLLSQCTALPFYEGAGYRAFGEIELDEGCPHRWMRKELGAD